MNPKQQSQQWSQIVAQAWADAAFKKRLLAEPAAVLKEHGITVPAGVQVKVVEDTEKVRHLTLPVKPIKSEPGTLSQEELAQVAAGTYAIGRIEPRFPPIKS